jgi:hypothetical protein
MEVMAYNAIKPDMKVKERKMDLFESNKYDKIKSKFPILINEKLIRVQNLNDIAVFFLMLGDNTIKFKSGLYKNRLVRDILIEDWYYCLNWYLSNNPPVFKDLPDVIKNTHHLIARYRLLLDSEYNYYD